MFGNTTSKILKSLEKSHKLPPPGKLTKKYPIKSSPLCVRRKLFLFLIFSQALAQSFHFFGLGNFHISQFFCISELHVCGFLTTIRTAGAGVILLTWIMESTSGICPSTAPAQKSLEEVRRMPLTPPNVDMATKTGIMKANDPYIRVAKV